MPEIRSARGMAILHNREKFSCAARQKIAVCTICTDCLWLFRRIFLGGKCGMKFHWRHTSEPFLVTLCVIKNYVIFNCRNQFVSRIEFPKIIHLGF